jgi:hypothetical protein
LVSTCTSSRRSFLSSAGGDEVDQGRIVVGASEVPISTRSERKKLLQDVDGQALPLLLLLLRAPISVVEMEWR